MTYQHILVSADASTADAITTITLNRPDKRNALSLEVILELTDALQTTAKSDARGVILAANGPVFSAGHNFGDMAGATLDEARHLFKRLHGDDGCDSDHAAAGDCQSACAGDGGGLPACGDVRFGDCGGHGFVCDSGWQSGAVLPHAAGGSGAKLVPQTGAGDGDDGRRHQRGDGGGLGADQPRRARRPVGCCRFRPDYPRHAG